MSISRNVSDQAFPDLHGVDLQGIRPCSNLRMQHKHYREGLGMRLRDSTIPDSILIVYKVEPLNLDHLKSGDLNLPSCI